jgi:hypothetical protein
MIGLSLLRALRTAGLPSLVLLALVFAPAALAQKGPGTSAGPTGAEIAPLPDFYLGAQEEFLAAWDRMGLRVGTATLVQRPAEGYGVVAPRSAAGYRSGEPILIYVELLGYRHQPAGDGWNFGVVVDWRVRSMTGEVLFEQANLLRQDMASAHRNTEFYVNLTYNLDAPPGTYLLETVFRDLYADQETTFEQVVEIL